MARIDVRCCQCGCCQGPPREQEPIDARTLLGRGRAVHIRLDGQLYRLSLTRSGKLILTK